MSFNNMQSFAFKLNLVVKLLNNLTVVQYTESTISNYIFSLVCKFVIIKKSYMCISYFI